MAAPSPRTLIDVVDDDDREVGVIERRLALIEGANFRVAHVFVTRQDELLAQQLSERRERNPLRWGSSVAGYLHHSEHYDDAARRRLDEEVGLQLPLREVGRFAMDDGSSKKFIALFEAEMPPDGTLPTVRERDHIERIEFVDMAVLDDAVVARPDEFTETFLFLYPRFRRARS